MEKEVFCKFGSRCKRVKYTKEDNVSDLEHIRRHVTKLAKSDPALQAWLDGVVFEIKHPSKDIMFEIEESDEVPNGAEITVATTAPGPSVPVPVLSPREVKELQEKVISGEVVMFDVPEDTDLDSLLDNTNNSPGSSPRISPIPEASSSKILVQPPKNIKVGVKSVPENFQLPKLPEDLKEGIKKFGAAYWQTRLIAFYADHLVALTDNAPKPSDYYNYAQAIVSAYPVLAGGQYNNGIVRSSLSIRVRNQRSFKKKKSLGVAGVSMNHKTNLLGDIAHGADHNEKAVSVDAEEAEKELKRCREMADCAHKRNLLKATYENRRQWIKSDAAGDITNIIETYPHLNQSSLLLYEFTLLRKEEDLAGLKNKVRGLLQKLNGVAAIAGADSDEKHIKVLIWLFGQLCQKRFLSGGVKELFIMNEAMSSLRDLETAPTNSPRLVFYLSEGSVCAAYIVADKTLQLKMQDLSVESAVLCLLASYYVFDTTYPVAYRATLNYLDHEILGTPTPNKQPTTAKFLRMMAAKDQSVTE